MSIRSRHNKDVQNTKFTMIWEHFSFVCSLFIVQTNKHVNKHEKYVLLSTLFCKFYFVSKKKRIPKIRFRPLPGFQFHVFNWHTVQISDIISLSLHITIANSIWYHIKGKDLIMNRQDLKTLLFGTGIWHLTI